MSMSNQASIVIIAKWKDEATAGLQNFGNAASDAAAKTTAAGIGMKNAASSIKDFGNETEKARLPSSRFRYETVALGAALNAIGGLIDKIDSPAAKMISNFLQISGTVALTVSTIAHALPYLSNLAASLQKVAIMQAIVKALSGPAGWITLGVGVAAGIGAGYAISNAGSNQPSGLIVNNYVQGSIVTEREMTTITRREIVKNQGRNAGKSGIQ